MEKLIVKSIDEVYENMRKSSHDAAYIAKFQHPGKRGKDKKKRNPRGMSRKLKENG